MSGGAGIVVRRATPDDAAGVALVLNAVIEDGRHSLLDTPFSVAAERAYIEGLPARSFIHIAELVAATPATPAAPAALAASASPAAPATPRIVGFQTLIPWNTFATHEFDHVATMGTYVAEVNRRRGVGRALADASFLAARELGYEKIFTDLRADNRDSLAYHLALGFTVVGTARGHARVTGRDVDVLFVECFL